MTDSRSSARGSSVLPFVLLGLVLTPALAASQTLTRIVVTPLTDTMTVQNVRSYHATAIFDDASFGDITNLASWESGDASVATVATTGEVTGVGGGETTVTASYGGASGRATVRVRARAGYLYTSAWTSPSSLQALGADLLTGALTPVGSQPPGASPWGVAIDPRGRVVYVANRGSRKVSAFGIASATGSLTLIGTYPTAYNSEVWSVVVDPAGRFLYASGKYGGFITAYAIGADGSLTAVPGTPVMVPEGLASTLAVHPSGEYLYVGPGTTSHRIAAYRIGSDGALTEVPGSPFSFGSGWSWNSLLDLAVHRSGRFLFVPDANMPGVSVVGINPATGALTAEVSRHAGAVVNGGIALHPDGQHVFATGQTVVDGAYVGALYAFTFDASTGTLTPVSGSPFPSPLMPTALALDHTGQWLFAVRGAQSAPSWDAAYSISVHQVVPATGQVTLVSTRNLGASLMGLAITADNAAPFPLALTRIEVTPANSTVETTSVGITRPFAAMGTYSDGRMGPLADVSWTSSAPAVATIDAATGVATIQGYGTTTITAQALGVSGVTSLTVQPAPLVALHVTPVAALVAPGGTRQLTATALYADGGSRDITATAAWSSSGPAVATVAGGRVTGVSGGAATISATQAGLTGSAQLVVRRAAVIAYAVDATGARVYGYQRAAGAAALAAVPGPPVGVGTDPEAAILDPTGRLLYVADLVRHQVWAFQVDGVSGQLLPAPGSPITTPSVSSRLAMDPAGRCLYVLAGWYVSAYAIEGATGRLTPLGVDQLLPFGGRSLAIDAGGRFLYVGAGFGDGADVIRGYRIDSATGALTNLRDTPAGRFPDALVSDPAGRFLYAANAGDDTLHAYAIDPVTGGLALASSIGTGDYPSRLAMHPSGDALYVGNRWDQTVTPFRVNHTTGALTTATTVPVTGYVTGLAVEPLGEYLYVTGAGLEQYAIDAAGALTRVQIYPTGTTPVDVTVGLAAPGASTTALAALTIVPASATVYGAAPGRSRQFIAMGTYSDGAQAFLTQSVTWQSSSPTQASISAGGLATSLAVPAEVTLVATLGMQAATATFAASSTPARLVVTPLVETLPIGSERRFQATAYYPDATAEDVTELASWESGDVLVATVTATGVVTGVGGGGTTITARYRGTSAAATVRVRGEGGYLYTSAWTSPDSVRGYRADLITGALTPAGSQPSGTSPWGVAVDPHGRWVYVANRSAKTVAAFSIASATGALTPLGTYSTGSTEPSSVVVESGGRFLYLSSSYSAEIVAFAIGGDGTLTPVPGSPFTAFKASEGFAVGLAVHPSGEYLYVTPGVRGHRIAAYRIGSDGALTAVAGSPFWFDDSPQANSLLNPAVHRSGRFLFVPDYGTQSVIVFGLDPGTGALTGEVSRHAGVMVNGDIVLHPDGQHVFATGAVPGLKPDGSATMVGLLYSFVFDASTGTLTPVSGSPFSSPLTPHALALDHTGRWLYAVNGAQSAASLDAGHSISIHELAATGQVTLVDTLNTGAFLMGVAIAPNDAAVPLILTRIDVTPANSTVETTNVGITRPFAAVGTYSDGRTGPLADVNWTSSSPEVATINALTGVATIQGHGTTTITAQARGVSGVTSLTVQPAPLVALHVTPLAAAVAPGGTRQLTATALYADGGSRDATATAAWSSSAPAVATVAGGRVTGVSRGAATISATLAGLTGSAQLVVRRAAVIAVAVDATGARVYGYQRAAGAAALAAVPGSPVGVGHRPETAVLDPTGRLLYVADPADNRIWAFQVDGVNGQLAPATGSPVAATSASARLAMDPAGRFLYALAGWYVSAYAIEAETGRLTPVGVDQLLPFGGRSLAVEAGGRFLYVGSGFGDGADVIRAYRIDPTTGALTNLRDTPAGRFPDALVSDPAGRFLYAANAGDDTLHAYAINPVAGGLALASSIGTSDYPWRLAVHPSGDVLYLGSRLGQSVVAFLMNHTTGALTPVTTAPVTGYVTGLAVEPFGEYLYVTGAGLEQYAIDAAGALTRVQTYTAGTTPVDVTLAPMDTLASSTTTVTCAASAVYTGSAIEACTVTVTGPGGLNATPTPTYTNNVNAGTATASYTYAGDPNHTGSSDSKTFEIAKKAASVTPAATTKVYGSADPALSGTLTGFVGSDSVMAGYSRTPGESVGTYTISATLAPSGVLGNYNIAYNTASLEITRATLTVTADDRSKLFGSPDPALTYQVSGLRFTDTVAGVLTGALARDAGEAVGTYTIRQGAAAANGNYTISFVTGTLTVTYNTCLLYDPAKGAKSGATIPIKIRVCSASGVNVSSPAIVVSAVQLLIEPTFTSGQVMDAGHANADGNFRFDTSLGPGYIFNLKTTGLVRGSYVLKVLVTNDPTPHLLSFQVQ